MNEHDTKLLNKFGKSVLEGATCTVGEKVGEMIGESVIEAVKNIIENPPDWFTEHHKHNEDFNKWKNSLDISKLKENFNVDN